MNATKMSQTVAWEKPERAQRRASSGVGATSRVAAAAVTPRMPMTGPGRGSVMSATRTAAKSAK